MRWILFILLLTAPVLGDGYREAVEAWHQQRLERLQKPDGWLSLVGLHWLSERDLKIDGVGQARLEGETVRFRFEPGVTLGEQELQTAAVGPDRPEGEDVYRHGSLRFFVIRRGPRVGLRVKDENSSARLNFKGIERFPVDPNWRLQGRLEPHETQVKTRSVVGVTTSESSPGRAVFSFRGKTYRPLLMGTPEDEKFFLVFADETSGRSTYSACRFLYVERDGDHGLILDFNKAFNPPCAFTPYATCPLPYPENVFDFAVGAGEKAPH